MNPIIEIKIEKDRKQNTNRLLKPSPEGVWVFPILKTIVLWLGTWLLYFCVNNKSYNHE